MARGATLGALVLQLRAEIGHSVDPAVGQEKLAQLKQVLRSTQEMLYDDYTWPFLRVRNAEKTLAIGQRYYDFPGTINPDRVETAHARWGDQWVPVGFGIEPEAEYNTQDSDAGETSDPVEKWDWYLDANGVLQFEVWPMPATAGTIRFSGAAPLSSLVAESDTADLDDRLIVLYAAADLRQGQKDAVIKEQKAAKRLRDLRGHGSKSGPVVLGGGHASRQRRHTTTIRIAGA